MKDRSSVWIAFVDMVLAILAVVIVAVNPKVVQGHAEIQGHYIISATWNVDIDSDVDLWLMPPSHKPVYFGGKTQGCETLDMDNRGKASSIIILADGSTSKLKESKEVIQLRCIEAGHYDVAVNMFSGETPVGVHVEVASLDTGKLVSQKDVTLIKQAQTINTMSFDIDPLGNLTTTPEPVTPVTELPRG